MNDQPNLKIARREIFRMLGLGVAAAATTTSASIAATTFPDKGKVRYRADSPDVQMFYRVNRYPGRTRR
jgi:hypothetical protein